MGIFDKLFGGSKQKNNTTQTPTSIQNINKNSLSSLNLDKEKSLTQLNLRKDMISSLCLEKKELNNLTARVAVVLDYSGSMEDLYENGTVQEILDRLLPVAMQFDDNGEMEVWLFENTYRRIKDISLDNYYNYIRNENILKKYRMGGTEYSPVINDVVRKYTKEQPSDLPTLVLFITDGDNFDTDKPRTTHSITQASKHPIFWQFVGIGRSSFNYLETLDEMEGRYVDNANFFSVNDIKSISDMELYNRLLGEYPSWIAEVRKKGMIK